MLGDDDNYSTFLKAAAAISSNMWCRHAKYNRSQLITCSIKTYAPLIRKVFSLVVSKHNA